MPKAWIELGDELAPERLFQGSLYNFSSDLPEFDVVAELRKVASEVSGTPIEQPKKQKLGFY